MTQDLSSLVKTVQSVNSLISTINKGLSNVNPNQVQQVKKAAEQIQKTADKVAQETKHESKPAKEDAPAPETSVTDYWGDSRYNPYFLRVAEFFGIDQREYPMAVDKLNAIVQWAERESNSKDISDMLKKIGSTSRTLQSPGFGEKRYAILYRYIKLSQQKTGLEKEMEAYKR